MPSLTYADSGVDIDAGDELVERIKPLAKRTAIPELLDGIGGFASLCAIPKELKDPVLVSGTDGVGTKLKVAFLANKHDTIGIDLVAMCVNDVITTGARPLFFLDYFATGKLDVAQAESVIRGIAEGCRIAGCALAGGETAEMPGFYQPGHYDLAGFVVGVVERDKIINGKNVQEGDLLVALPSSGLHSNGFSLARRALLEGKNALDLDFKIAKSQQKLIDVLLEPTTIYAAAVARLMANGEVRALAHITGGGISGNLPRVLPEGLGAQVWTSSWEIPEIFGLIAQCGNVDVQEMQRTFNMGVGLIAVMPEKDAQRAVQVLADQGTRAWIAGSIVRTTDPNVRVVYSSHTRS